MKTLHFFGFVIGLGLLISCSSDSNTKRFNLTTTATPSEGGTITPSSGEHEDGEQLELSASSNEHWLFDGWQGDLSGNTNPKTITMDSDKSVAALFVKRDYPLTITIQGAGTVSEQIIQQKATDYPHGTVVELTADPAEGAEFEGWQGDIETTENPTTVSVEEETEITAIFSGVEYPLEVTVEGEGTVSEEVVQSKTDYPEGTLVELTAQAADNWIFSEWSGDLEGEENPSQLTVDSPKEVTAMFLRTYNLITNADPEEGGSITPEAGQYVQDTTFEVEAVPVSNGWRFVEWEGDFSGSVNPFDLTMNGDKTITATFERKEFELNTTIEGEGEIARTLLSGDETEEDTYLFESEVRLTALPADGWVFEEWEGDVSSTEEIVEVQIEGVTDITVRFTEMVYLAENGITITCPKGRVGEVGIVDGEEYEVVDRVLLEQRLDEGKDLSKLCVSLVTDMSQLFYQENFNESIANWDVSNVIDMQFMFSISLFNQPITDWDVSNVTNMKRMFYGSPFNQFIGDWEVGNVIDMSFMFMHSDFNKSIENWDVSNVTNMYGMFIYAVFNQSIGNWDVSNVTDMGSMFRYSDFNQPIGNWDVGNVTNVERIFSVSAFNQSISNWDLSKVKSMKSMFAYSDFNQPIGNWNVSNVTDMMYTFEGSDFNQSIGNWDVNNVTNMYGMFKGSKFNKSISNWDVSKVSNMGRMFSENKNFNQPIGDWDVSSVTIMSGMFNDSIFNQPIKEWNVRNVERMPFMFQESNFNQVINTWCVSNIPVEPQGFSSSSPLIEENKPIWGTCPE